jgi:hypothetical protein
MVSREAEEKGEAVSPHKLGALREQSNEIEATVSSLREGSEKLTHQLVSSIDSIEKSLNKSFENSKSVLVR